MVIVIFFCHLKNKDIVMRLNSKFLSIVAVTVVLVGLLTFSSISGAKKVTDTRQYQLVQTKVNSELADAIVYLNNMDYRAFQTTVAYREWNNIIVSLDENFDYLVTSPITKTFNDTLKENLESTQTLWEMLKQRFEPVESVFKEMESVKVSVSEQNDVQTNGIRETYEANPDNENLQKLYDLLLVAHEEIKGIGRVKDTLSRLNYQSTILMTQEMKKVEKLFTLTSIVLAIVSSVFLALLILIVTTKVSQRIVSIEKITEILAKKDFSVKLKPNGSAEMQSLMRNMNQMIDQINDFFIVVKTAASKAISSGYMITDSANSTAAASGQIADNLDTISREFEQITGAVQRAVTVISEMNLHIDTLVENNQKQTVAIENSNNAVNEVVETLEYMNDMAIKRTQSAQEMNSLIDDGDAKITSTKNVLNDINSNNQPLQLKNISLYNNSENNHEKDKDNNFTLNELSEKFSRSKNLLERSNSTISQSIINNKSNSKIINDIDDSEKNKTIFRNLSHGSIFEAYKKQYLSSLKEYKLKNKKAKDNFKEQLEKIKNEKIPKSKNEELFKEYEVKFNPDRITQILKNEFQFFQIDNSLKKKIDAADLRRKKIFEDKKNNFEIMHNGMKPSQRIIQNMLRREKNIELYEKSLIDLKE